MTLPVGRLGVSTSRVLTYPISSERVCGVVIEDLREHRRQPCEVGFGSCRVACAVQLGQVRLLPVESGAAFREQEIEELASGTAIALTELICSCRLRILGPPVCLRREQMSLTG